MADPSPRKFRSVAFFVIVNLLSLVCLLWALHGLRFGRLWAEFWHLRWDWVGLAIASNLLSYVVQAWRWGLVLAPVTPVPIRESVRAVFVGVYANEVLPLRSGEIIRCYLLARCIEMPVSVSLASALIERIFDGVWLIIAMFITLQFVPLPALIRHSGVFLGILILVCAVGLAIAMYWREQTLDALVNVRWFGWVHVLIKDLHLIGHSRYLYYAFGASFLYIVLQVFPIYAVLHAYHGLEGVPAIAALTVSIMLRFNAVLPQAPGNVGTFPGAVILGLRPFRHFVTVPSFPATSRWGPYEAMTRNFSVILLAVITLPLLIAGFIAVALTGMNIGDIHRSAHDSMKDRDAVPETTPPDRR